MKRGTVLEMLFEELSTRWLEVSAYEVKETTHHEYVRGIRQLNEHFGKLKPYELTPKLLQDYLNELYLKGKSKGTINKQKYLVQQVYRYINLSGLTVSNPCAFVRAPRLAQKASRRSLSEKEIKIILQNRDLNWASFYTFCLLFLGLRRSEMMALCWEDIDFENETIHINKVVTYLNSKPKLNFVLKNGWRDRFVPIPKVLLAELKTRLPNDKGYMFAGIKGGLMNENVINRSWTAYRDRVGLKEVTQHMVRHTYATMLYDADIDIKAAAALLGHSDERTTLMIYTHINKEREAQKAMVRLNQYINDTYGELL